MSERDQLVERFIEQSFAEQKASRRWGVFFKSLTFLYLFVALLLFVPVTGLWSGDKGGEHTALVRIKGVIADDKPASANAIVTGLRAAFEAENAKAVLLSINSPGGSPVQAGYVFDEIKRLRGLHPDKKLYAVISDLGASGGYYIAAAADAIYADKASLVGSIGVTAAGFGFVDAMAKLGVERRQFTSGEHKAFLDPFSPVKADEVEFWQSVLRNTHNQFIAAVKVGRGDRLNAQAAGGEQRLFSGLIWNGEQALQLGLVDGLGSPGFVAREIIGAEDIIDYSFKPSPLMSLVRQMGAAAGSALATQLGGGAELSLR